MTSVRFPLLLAAFAALAAASWQHPEGLGPKSDAQVFRRWFAFLAESRYYARKTAAEVPDGQSLVRWAWRNTVVPHDRAWLRSVELPVLPAMRQASVSQSTLNFRDLPPRHFVSLDVADLQPGDLLLYDRPESDANVMVFVGPSQVVPSSGNWVVYCAGPPLNGLPLRVHRQRLEELLADPYSGWRPVAGNPDFLGVWRLDPALE